MTAQPKRSSDDPSRTIERLDAVPDRVVVGWADGHESVFPTAWLRHQSAFPAHLDGVTQEGAQRRPAPAGSLRPDGLALTAEGDLAVTWRPGGETTRHPATWLRDHCPSATERARRRRRPLPWAGVAPPEFSYAQVAADARTRLAFYRALLDHGLVILRAVPPEDGRVAEAAELIGPVHETGYGRVVDVKTTSELAIEANTPKRLEPHTDESYRYAPPGISLFHCLQAAPKGGGESLLVDGFAVAEALRETAPAAFDRLSRLSFSFRDSGGAKIYVARGRVISLDQDGNVVGIRYSDRALLPLDLPVDHIEPAYDALRAWAGLLYDARFPFRYLMKPGDLHVFDNHRVLHGRTAFNVGQGTRHLQQCAVDRDEFHSNFRMLAKRLGEPDWADELPGGAQG